MHVTQVDTGAKRAQSIAVDLSIRESAGQNQPAKEAVVRRKPSTGPAMLKTQAKVAVASVAAATTMGRGSPNKRPIVVIGDAHQAHTRLRPELDSSPSHALRSRRNLRRRCGSYRGMRQFGNQAGLRLLDRTVMRSSRPMDLRVAVLRQSPVLAGSALLGMSTVWGSFCSRFDAGIRACGTAKIFLS